MEDQPSIELFMDLESLRKQIDLLDENLLQLLKKRFSLTHQVGKLKKQRKLPIEDAKREEEILSRLLSKAETFGLGGGFIKSLFKQILEESKKEQAR